MPFCFPACFFPSLWVVLQNFQLPLVAGPLALSLPHAGARLPRTLHPGSWWGPEMLRRPLQLRERQGERAGEHRHFSPWVNYCAISTGLRGRPHLLCRPGGSDHLPPRKKEKCFPPGEEWGWEGPREGGLLPPAPALLCFPPICRLHSAPPGSHLPPTRSPLVSAHLGVGRAQVSSLALLPPTLGGVGVGFNLPRVICEGRCWAGELGLVTPCPSHTPRTPFSSDMEQCPPLGRRLPEDFGSPPPLLAGRASLEGADQLQQSQRLQRTCYLPVRKRS